MQKSQKSQFLPFFGYKKNSEKPTGNFFVRSKMKKILQIIIKLIKFESYGVPRSNFQHEFSTFIPTHSVFWRFETKGFRFFRFSNKSLN